GNGIAIVGLIKNAMTKITALRSRTKRGRNPMNWPHRQTMKTGRAIRIGACQSVTEKFRSETRDLVAFSWAARLCVLLPRSHTRKIRCFCRMTPSRVVPLKEVNSKTDCGKAYQ